MYIIREFCKFSTYKPSKPYRIAIYFLLEWSLFCLGAWGFPI